MGERSLPWKKPRHICVVVDNPSWILDAAERLVELFNGEGDHARLCRHHDEIDKCAAAFYLGCVKIAPPEILAKADRNLVVHASDLPRGRGFSPWTWAIIDGQNEIPICLIEAAPEVDSGPIVARDVLRFRGDELVDELRAVISDKTIELCHNFLQAPVPPVGIPQTGQSQTHRRRHPSDSQIDPDRPLADQFNLLRTVDNTKYPAFFDHKGCRYRIMIFKEEVQAPGPSQKD